MKKPTGVAGQRIGAWIIDALVLFPINLAIFFAMAEKRSDIARDLLQNEVDPETTLYGNIDIGDEEYSLVGGDFAIYLLIITAIWLAYSAVLPGIKGWTLGKLATGIRVVDTRGTCPAGIGRNLGRQLLWIVDSFPWFIPNLVGLIVMLVTSRNQRVGDLVAGTLVVRKEAAGTALEQYPGQGAARPYAGAPPPGQYRGGPAPGMPPRAAPPPREPAPAQQAAPPPQRPTPPAPEPASAPKADWYPDPKREKRLRYWDGSRWTEQTAD
jgi:uncharacterized RDD family membrane protein YckC